MSTEKTPPLNRTKIIATLGPATDDPERLAAVFEAGVDVCRLNFSHGTLPEHENRLSAVRGWARAHDQPIAVIGDLCGPKIRINAISGTAIELRAGDPVRFVRGDADCVPERLTVNYPRFVDEVDVGQRVYIDDGLVRLLVTGRDDDAVTCTCTAGGRVSSHKGVNLPDTQLSTPALTDKDRGDLDFAIQHELDYVALSFARHPDDLTELEQLIQQRGGDLGIIIKIEKAEALDHLDEFISRADGIMVARGDLGVEMDVWRVPLMQKEITARCRAAGKPVIVATQMLQSMVSAPVPTRAEVSDVANAILDGADAVMLSAETAVGRHPSLAVAMMDRVAHATEAHQRQHCQNGPPPPAATTPEPSTAVAHAAVLASRQLDARLVAVWSATGETVRRVACHRLPVPVVGLTYDERVQRRMNLLFGVIPIRVEPLSHPGEMAAVLDRRLHESGLALRGDLIVVVTSTQPRTPGSTDTVLVHRVGTAIE